MILREVLISFPFHPTRIKSFQTLSSSKSTSEIRKRMSCGDLNSKEWSLVIQTASLATNTLKIVHHLQLSPIHKAAITYPKIIPVSHFLERQKPYLNDEKWKATRLTFYWSGLGLLNLTAEASSLLRTLSLPTTFRLQNTLLSPFYHIVYLTN